MADLPDLTLPLPAPDLVARVNATENRVAALEEGGGSGLDATGQPSGHVPTAQGDDSWEWAAQSGGGGGAVASVNGKTGTVVLSASDVGAATSAQGALADTAVQPGDLATVATTGAYADLSGRPTIPSTPGDVGAAPAVHTHDAGDVATGTMNVYRLPWASTTGKGIVERATTAEVLEGTDGERYVSPAGVKAALDAAAGGASIQDMSGTGLPGRPITAAQADITAPANRALGSLFRLSYPRDPYYLVGSIKTAGDPGSEVAIGLYSWDWETGTGALVRDFGKAAADVAGQQYAVTYPTPGLLPAGDYVAVMVVSTQTVVRGLRVYDAPFGFQMYQEFNGGSARVLSVPSQALGAFPSAGMPGTVTLAGSAGAFPGDISQTSLSWCGVRFR